LVGYYTVWTVRKWTTEVEKVMNTQTTRPTGRSAITPPRAGACEWAGLSVLALALLLLAVDATVLDLAVPAISADLAPTTPQLLWIIDVYSFVLAGLLVVMGNLGDRIGRRRLLLLGAAGFGIASVLAAWAPTPEMLIAARVLQGVAGATLMPATLALIRSMSSIRGSARSRSRCGARWRAVAPRRDRCWAAGCSSTTGGVRCSW
jgi:DHA2 family multidrug resistance protein-like MFS transporter